MDYSSFQPNPPLSQIPQQIPPVQKTFTPKFIWVVVGLLVLGGVASAGLWFWNDKNKEAVVPTFTPRPDVTADWQIYTNTQYGFTIILNDDWEGYKVVSDNTPSSYYQAKYSFCLPTSDKQYPISKSCNNVQGYEDLLDLAIFTPDQWQKNLSNPVGLQWHYVGKDSNYVVGFSRAQDVSLGLDNQFQEISQILATFKFIEPESIVCIQVITPAQNQQTGEVRDFPTPCDVPAGWVKI